MKLLDRFRRITSAGSYDPAIDGLRFLAIALVLAKHGMWVTVSKSPSSHPAIYAAVFSTPIAEYGLGVFFALSAYILVGGLMRSQAKGGLKAAYVKKYYLRRVTRIEPPYVIVLTVTFLFLLITHRHADATANFGKSSNLYLDYLASLFYQHNLIYGHRSRILGPAWTLEIEVQFYLLAPLVAIGLARLTKRPFWILGVIGMALMVAWGYANYTSILLPYAFPSVLGGILALLASKDCESYKHRRMLADLAATGALLAILVTGVLYKGQVAAPWMLLITFATTWGTLNGNFWRRIFSYSSITLVGGMCYSIYLVHMQIIETLSPKLSRFGLNLPIGIYIPLQVLLLCIPTLVLSFIFYILVERPCMAPDWPQRAVAFVKRCLGARHAMPISDVAAPDPE